MTRSDDFSLRDLHDALDAQRQARGISWSQAAKEINGEPARVSARQMISTTVKGTRTGAVAEGDGISQMLRWLNRTPESFVPGHQGFEEASARLPGVAPGHVLRFDTRKLHVALEAQRMERKLRWAQVAMEVGVGISTLSHLAKGGRTAFPQVMRIVRWLGRPAAHFTRESD